ncbi:MAG: hypothetical protein VX944_05035, partial [Myxococcota bacterium]|nr:hypothetical protein [Myxococcota bacterium]
MKVNTHTLLLIAFASACNAADEDELAPAHATCRTLDERGVENRIDATSSNRQDVFALDGHCLEATSVIPYGDVVGVRFSPEASTDQAPFYIELFFVPPTSPATLPVFEPQRLSNAKCVDVEPGFFCGHVNDVVNTPNIEVDLRGKGGTLTFDRVRNAGNG